MFLKDFLFSSIDKLSIQVFPNTFILPGRDPFQPCWGEDMLPAEQGSVFTGTSHCPHELQAPCYIPALQMGLQAEHTQMSVRKAESPLPLLFVKWFNLTQTEIAGVISQPSPPLPTCSLLAQLTTYRLKHRKLWNSKSFKFSPENGLQEAQSFTGNFPSPFHYFQLTTDTILIIMANEDNHE